MLDSKENEKLFNQMSNAIRDQDFDKLDELAESPETEDINTETEHEDAPVDEPEVNDDTHAIEPETKEDVEPKEEDKLAEALALLEKVKSENHALKSQAGRVPHLQRQVQQFDKKLEELQQLATSPSSRPSSKVKEKIEPKLSKIRDIDPELAEILDAIVSETTDGVANDLRDAEMQSLQRQREAAIKEFREAEASRLLEMYPNAGEVFKSASWKQWEGSQTAGVKALANSDHADDVALAFERYTQDMTKLHPELNKQSNTEEAERIEAERKRKLGSSAVLGAGNVPAVKSKNENPAAMFEEFSKQIRKEISGG